MAVFVQIKLIYLLREGEYCLFSKKLPSPPAITPSTMELMVGEKSYVFSVQSIRWNEKKPEDNNIILETRVYPKAFIECFIADPQWIKVL